MSTFSNIFALFNLFSPQCVMASLLFFTNYMLAKIAVFRFGVLIFVSLQVKRKFVGHPILAHVVPVEVQHLGVCLFATDPGEVLPAAGQVEAAAVQADRQVVPGPGRIHNPQVNSEKLHSPFSLFPPSKHM